MATTTTRSANSIWLVGGTENFFKTSKLPSRGEVLKVLFHHHVDDGMNLKDSVDKTMSMLLPIWAMARIPTKAPNHVVEHIRKLHAEWQGLKKRINRKSASNMQSQEIFQDSLNELFDIAHRDALSLIKIEEDRLFLEAQRETGRRGTMAGVDRSLTQKEERIIKRNAAAEKYAIKVKLEASTSTATAVATDTSESDLPSDPENEPSTPKLPRLKPKLRGTVDVVTPAVAAALDRTNTSDRKAAHIFLAMGSTGQLKFDTEDLIISPSAIRRSRMKHRECFASEIRATFDPEVPLIIHWDGKIMDDCTATGNERDRVDRLPILVSGQSVVKLLSVPKLHNGTAAAMFQAITQTIDEWNLRNRIKGLCFDTTASNTGSKNGVCVQLETEFGQQLLNLACRHHISEIMLEKAYGIHDVSRSPNLELFGHFKDFWPRIDQTSFTTALNDESTAAVIAPWKDDVIQFAMAQLEKLQPRDDYCEILELSIIFLGGVPPKGIKFRYPGAIHRARWMARAIYSIKMWLFRSQYEPLQPGGGSRKSHRSSYKEQVWHHLKNVCLFVTAVYLKYWIESPLSTAAPRNDLALLCSLSIYPDKEIANAATAAFQRHLWYLSEVLVGFGFFDDGVSIEEKKLMVLALRESQGSDELLKRIEPFEKPLTKALHDFVTTTTRRFFQVLGLSEDFLQLEPSAWNSDEAYIKNQKIAQSVAVVNDLAERGVALMQEFNSSITRNEEQKQYLLQVIENHRTKFPAPTKIAAIENAQQTI